VSDQPAKRGGFLSALRRAVTREEQPAPPAEETRADEPQPLAPEAVETGGVGTAGDAPVAVVEPPAETPPKKQGWFQRLKQGLVKTSTRLSQDIAGILTKRKLDAETLEELEDLLIQADLGVDTAARITEALAKDRHNKEISPEEVRAVLAAEVERTLAPVARPLTVEGSDRPHVILVVGVNGTGKTTTIGKLAHSLALEGKTVMLAAGDTARRRSIS
jgi:fused signal recognition particle receptor